MKCLLIVLASFLLAQTSFSIAQSDDTATEGKPNTNWMTFYYKSPMPERFVNELRAMTDAGILKDDKSQPSFIAFFSQVMAQNPKKVREWLKEFENLDEKQRTTILAAAWYSDTDAAKAYFKEKQLNHWVEQIAPDILEMKVDNPATLDMLWAYFMATGKKAPIRRIVSALQLSKYSGAAKRYRESKQTDQDKKEAWYDATFQAAQWSLKANCNQHPKVLEHCEHIFRDKSTPKAESVWLGLILTKVKPQNYKVEIDGEQPSNKLTPE